MMRHRKRIVVILAIFFALVLVYGLRSAPAPELTSQQSVAAAAEETETSRSSDESLATREETLAWLDQYLTREVLFNKQDIEALQAKVTQMSSEELNQWLDTTREIRALLDSDEWRSTRIWLEGYMPQRFYNDRQVQEFRADVAKLTPNQLHDLLERIKRKHETLQSVHATVTASTVRDLQAQTTAQIQQQTRMNWQQRFRQSQTEARQRAVGRNQTRSSRPLYGRTQAYASRQRAESERRFNRPIVTSQDAARRAVYGGFRYGW